MSRLTARLPHGDAGRSPIEMLAWLVIAILVGLTIYAWVTTNTGQTPKPSPSHSAPRTAGHARPSAS